MNKHLTPQEIEELLKNSTQEIKSEEDFVIDENNNRHNVEEVISQAEKDIKKKYPKVNFRWSEFEIKRAKKIAAKLGMPYQTYIKSILKQGLDNDERRLMQM